VAPAPAAVALAAAVAEAQLAPVLARVRAGGGSTTADDVAWAVGLRPLVRELLLEDSAIAVGRGTVLLAAVQATADLLSYWCNKVLADAAMIVDMSLSDANLRALNARAMAAAHLGARAPFVAELQAQLAARQVLVAELENLYGESVWGPLSQYFLTDGIFAAVGDFIVSMFSASTFEAASSGWITFYTVVIDPTNWFG
jgi:hypothetical protein